MSENGTANAQGGQPPASEKIPFWQRVCDNHFLLLFLGVVIPTVLYIMWGIMELVQIPVAAP